MRIFAVDFRKELLHLNLVIMKKISHILILAFIVLLIQSCSVMKDVTKTDIVPDYYLTLDHVEFPANSKEQFGEVITDKTNEDSIRYTFEDEYLKISWFSDDSYFYFKLLNKSKHSLKVIWDDVTLVMPDNNISKMMHNGIKYDKRNETQVPTTIPRGAKIEDALVPTNNVKYVGDWIVTPILPKNIEMSKAEQLKGGNLKILLPIKIEDITNEYTFVFNIKDVYPKEVYSTEKVHNKEAEIVANTFIVVSSIFFALVLFGIM